jgi:hypothetical protein
MKTPIRQTPPTPWLIATVLLFAALGASGCLDTNVLEPEDAAKKDGLCEQEYGYEARKTANDFDGVDLLVVIDNSTSMSEEQDILTTGFFTLVNSLTLPLSLANDPEWGFPAIENMRVAVVTSDMGLQWGPNGEVGGKTIPVSQCERDRGDNGAFQGRRSDVTQVRIESGVIRCEQGGGQCPAGYSCDENNLCTAPDPADPMVSCNEDIAGTWAETTAAAPNADFTTQVACLAKQGTEGCGVEQQLEAAHRGLSNNPDFMVETHLLAVLIVSDEEDCSIESNGLFETDEWLSGTLPGGYLNVACNCALDEDGRCTDANEQYLFDPADYHQRFVELKGGQATAVLFGAIVGVPPGTPGEPSSCEGTGEELKANGCLKHDDMELEIQTFVYDESGQTYEHFRPACTRNAMVDGEEVTVTSARPGRRYVKAAQEFGSNSYVYSICNEDWSPAMRRISGLIARQITAACFPDELEWSLLPQEERDELGCDNCGKSECDVMVEVVRVGAELGNEECPEDLYAWLSESEQQQYLDQKQVKIEEKNGKVTKKTIVCPLPKLSTPRDCLLANDFVRNSGTYPPSTVGWFYCEKDGENFNDACDDGIDNDDADGIDCDDPKCGDCEVCDGTGVDCENGCRYGVEITDRAKRLATGHFVSVRCDPKPTDDPDC